jgi:hypothetical protein
MFRSTVLWNRCIKWNETFLDCLNGCTWVTGSFSNFSGYSIFSVKFENEHSNRWFSKTTHQNGMKLSQIFYTHVLELLELFHIFWKCWIWVKIWKWTFNSTILSNQSVKWNETFTDQSTSFIQCNMLGSEYQVWFILSHTLFDKLRKTWTWECYITTKK